MPWFTGVMEVKGSKEDLIKFMSEVLKSEGKAVYQQLPNMFSVKQENELYWFYIEGTHQNFIITKEIVFNYDEKKDDYVLVLENYKADWNIDPKPLAHLSREYNIDFKVYGFNKDLEFYQEVEIIKGNINKDVWINLDQYDEKLVAC